EAVYRFDIAKYGKQISLAEANEVIAQQSHAIAAFLSPKIQNCAAAEFGGEDLILFFDHKQDRSADFIPQFRTKRSILETLLDNPRMLGEAAQLVHQEFLPSVRLWIHWKRYMIGGVPDGIGDKYVYEFKTTTQKSIEIQKDLAIRQ